MEGWDRHRLRGAAARILAAGRNAADPSPLLRAHLGATGHRLRVAGSSLPVTGRLAVVAAGKAAVPMAREAERLLGALRSEALAIAPSPPSIPLERTRTLVAGHPLPDRRGLRAAREVERVALGLGREDVLLLLLSGGASALLPAPAEGISLSDKVRLTSQVLRAGATIHDLNTVRKHLSRLKGGGLARAAAPARVVCLALSDVVGDDPSTIASGPTVPDPTTYAQALAVLERLAVLHRAPSHVRQRLEAGARGEAPETPKPGAALFRRVTTQVIGGNRACLEAAAREARRLGLRPRILTSRLEGEAREVAQVLVAVLRECVDGGGLAAPPVCLLAGGETTVTVRGAGHGGRNQELVVAAAEPLSTFPAHAVAASLATDGIDGHSRAAGGVVDQESIPRAARLGLAPAGSFLAESDSQGFLAPLGDLIVTGETGTNVMDLTVLLAGNAGRRV
jgi:hydroxypyruvate reductase